MSPIVGATIGYVANKTAVKLIFWPARKIRILNVPVPMTPGMFVKRRREFAQAFSQTLVDKFMSPGDIKRIFQKILGAGVEERLMNALPPMAVGLLQRKINSLTKADIDNAAESINKFIVETGLVEKLIVENVEAMDVMDIERMVRSVCGRELRSMALFDAALGGIVGLGQALAVLLLS